MDKTFFINILFIFEWRFFRFFFLFIYNRKKRPSFEERFKVIYLFICILRFPIAVASMGSATTLLPVCFSVSELR